MTARKVRTPRKITVVARKKRSLRKDGKERKQRSDCIIENHPQKDEIDEMIMDWVPYPEIAQHFGDFADETVRTYSKRSGLEHKRLHDTESVLNCVIKRGCKTNRKIDGRTMVGAMTLRSRIRGEVKEGDTNINIQVPAQNEFNDRLTQAQVIRRKPLKLAPVSSNGDQN